MEENKTNPTIKENEDKIEKNRIEKKLNKVLEAQSLILNGLATLLLFNEQNNEDNNKLRIKVIKDILNCRDDCVIVATDSEMKKNNKECEERNDADETI